MKKGDRVALYMPASPLLAASMLACARIGAIHRYTCTGVNDRLNMYSTSIVSAMQTRHEERTELIVLLVVRPHSVCPLHIGRMTLSVVSF